VIRLAVLQHESETGLGRFADILDDFAVDYQVVSTTRGTLPDPFEFDGALVLGGSRAADDPTLLPTRSWVQDAVLGELPYLGICLGGQLLASALGARVGPGGAEAGIQSVFLTDAGQHDFLFEGLARRFDALGWHGDSFDLPRHALPLAGSLACTHQAFRYGNAAYALQFHPEVRPQDIASWRGRPSYRQLLDFSGRDWSDLVRELEHVAPALDKLATELLERWLCLVVANSALRPRLRLSA
jgi:GMP synthase-like glutamine amidotransferase